MPTKHRDARLKRWNKRLDLLPTVSGLQRGNAKLPKKGTEMDKKESKMEMEKRNEKYVTAQTETRRN